MTIGQTIREIRKINGLTQKQLAEYANVSTKFIVELENDKPTIELNKLRHVLDVFDMEISLVSKKRISE